MGGRKVRIDRVRLVQGLRDHEWVMFELCSIYFSTAMAFEVTGWYQYILWCVAITTTDFSIPVRTTALFKQVDQQVCLILDWYIATIDADYRLEGAK